MKTRIECFEALAAHALLGRVFSKLKVDELIIARLFLLAHEQHDRGSFDTAVNHMFVDAVNRPKNSSAIMELLSCANTVFYNQEGIGK